jgi:tetratricopeptide (TPR) repeat protein
MIVARLAERHITSDRAVFIHHLLGLPVEADFVSQLSAPVLRQRTVEALAALIIAEAVNEPTALVIEDVHWIDAASQEVVSAVVEAMTHVPLLLILVYRPEYLHAWSDKAYHSEISLARLGGTSTAAMVRAILSKSYAERVALEHLSAEQSHAMIADLLGTATIPLELERLIATQTDGNPLFIEELTRSLLESGDLVHQGDGYVLGRPAEAIVVPTSVQGVLIERVDRLDPELRTLVQVASVLGRVFAFRLLEAVAPGRGALERQLLELEDLEFMYPTSLTPEREYSFKHVLTQEAVYDTLLRSRREAYHERAGRAIEALYADRLEEFYERLAYHYIRSPNMGKALDYLELANQKAAGAYAMAEAKTYFEQAMQLLDVMPDRPDNRHRRIVLLANQFLVFWLLYQPAEYLELLYRYEAMANDQDDIGLLGTFYKHMGHCQWVFGDMAGALKTLERAVAASEAGGNSSAAGMAYTMFAWTHLELANYQEVATSERKALHAFDRQFNFLDYTWARMALAWAYAQQGRWQDAVSECEDTMRLAYEYRDDSAVSFSYFMLAWIHASWGRVQRAIEFANMALEKAPTPADRCWAQTFMGFSLCRAGQADRAVELLASLVPVYDSAQFMPGVVLNLTPLGEAYWRAGRLEEARQTLEEATDRAERMGLRFYLGWAQRLLGEVTRQSDPTPEGEARAAAHFQRGIDLLREIGAENELALAHAGYGRLCDQRGRTGEAGEHLGRAMEIFERLGTHV